MAPKLEALTAGVHTFKTPSGRVLGYHVTPSSKPSAPIWIQSSVGWGAGRGYVVRGLSPLLASHFTVVALSARGTEESERPKDAEGNDDPTQMAAVYMADDVELLRQHLGLDKIPVLSGHSHGGAISLFYAENYPDNVEKVILNTSQLMNHAGFWTEDSKRLTEKRKDDPQYKKAYETVAGPRPTTDEEMATWFTNICPVYLAHPERDLDKVLTAMTGPMINWCLEASNPADVGAAEARTNHVDKLPDVKAKTLLICGTEDPVCGVGAAKIQEKAIPNAQLVVLEDCGHFPWQEKPEEFMDVVLKFTEA